MRQYLRAIADGYTKTTEIAAYAGLPVANVSKILDRLRELRYIDHVAPVDFDKKTRRGHWRIGDPYFQFWFRYVFSNRSRLQRGLVDEVHGEIEADLTNYVGRFVFEDCCRVWAGQSSPLAAQIREIGSWWSRTADVEIDVVGAGKSSYVLLGSCKWTGEVGENTIGQLFEHRARLGPKAARAQLVVFARGFRKKVQEEAKASNVLLVPADELFS